MEGKAGEILNSRSSAREQALIKLYQINIREEKQIPYDDIIKDNLPESFLSKLIDGVLKKDDELNNLANQYLKDWKINRLDKLGAIILKMAFYEIIYMDTPKIVVVNEAINMAKKYCDEELAKMINATLDSYIKEKKLV